MQLAVDSRAVVMITVFHGPPQMLLCRRNTLLEASRLRLPRRQEVKIAELIFYLSNSICPTRSYALPPDKFRVGLIQMSMKSDPDSNLQHAIERVTDAAAQGAKIVCLPELFQKQYFCQREDTSLFDLAEPIPGPTSARLSETAKRLGIVLIASLFEKRAAGVYHNTAAMFDADGTLRGIYRK